MTMSNAASWAQSVEGTSFRISEVERIAFRSHPDVLAAISADGDEAATEADRSRRRGTGWLWLLIGIVVLVAPVLGVAVYGQHSYLDIPPLPAQTSMPIAGVCFLITVVLQLVFAVGWLAQGALWSPLLLAYALLTSVLAGFAAVGMPNAAAAQQYDLGPWRWPSLIALGVGVALTIALLLRIAARGRVSARATGWKRVRQTVGALPAAERRCIRAERNEAVRVLGDRGILDATRMQLASGAELGRLHRLEAIWKELDERSDR